MPDRPCATRRSMAQTFEYATASGRSGPGRDRPSRASLSRPGPLLRRAQLAGQTLRDAAVNGPRHSTTQPRAVGADLAARAFPIKPLAARAAPTKSAGCRTDPARRGGQWAQTFDYATASGRSGPGREGVPDKASRGRGRSYEERSLPDRPCATRRSMAQTFDYATASGRSGPGREGFPGKASRGQGRSYEELGLRGGGHCVRRGQVWSLRLGVDVGRVTR